jgi:hypothetical protein
MSGKTIDEAREAQKKDKESKKKPGGGGKYQISVKAADGKTYMAYMDSPPPDIPEFAAIADAERLPSVPEDTVEYLGWVALDEGLNMAANASIQTELNNPATALQAMPSTLPLQKQHTHCVTGEFWLDTGVTVHISPDAHDFHSLCKIEPRVVHVLGSASVTAVGIGDIRLHVR